MKVKKIAFSALFMAFVYLMTMISVSLGGNGYSNLGDAAVLLSYFALGPVVGAIVSAVGSALTDITLGYFMYAPATFIIKGLMPLIFAGLYKMMLRASDGKTFAPRLVSAVLCELFMAVMYYLFNALFIVKSFAGAVISLATDGLQGGVCFIAFMVISEACERLKLFEKWNAVWRK